MVPKQNPEPNENDEMKGGLNIKNDSEKEGIKNLVEETEAYTVTSKEPLEAT